MLRSDEVINIVLTKLKNLFTSTSALDNGKYLKIKDGTATWVQDNQLNNLKTLFDVSEIDNGKILRIVEGRAVWVETENAEEVGF